MSPSYIDQYHVCVSQVTGYGNQDFTDFIYQNKGVRPVLSLKSSVNITSGDGTELKPYVVN